jgi:hypothetical protein
MSVLELRLLTSGKGVAAPPFGVAWAGVMTLSAAEAWRGRRGRATRVLDLLSSQLVDMSLVVAESVAAVAARLYLLETLRQYAKTC